MLKEKWTSLKGRYLPYIIAYSVKFLMSLILRTCRIEITNLHHFTQTAGKRPCILTFWHNQFLIMPEIHTRFKDNIYTVLISKSRDGNILAACIESYDNYRTLRVHHSKGEQPLRAIIERLQTTKEVIVMTPDGPRGPAFSAKPGIVLAAYKSGAHIIPCTWRANRYWRLKNWDGTMIPKPFSTITIDVKKPIVFSNCNPKDLSQEIKTLESALSTDH